MKKNTKRGITLIALVITIVVMLILVAVTISMAVNGGLFEYASNAGAQTNAAVDAEQEFANLAANMTVNQLIDKYTQNSNGCGKCIDGYIAGYVCSNYGEDCFIINESYTKIDLDTIQLSKCLHYNSSKNADKGNYPCPVCTISFSFDGGNYNALKDITWEEWINNDKYANMWRICDNYVCYGDIVHYEDGTRVKPTDKIRSRIRLYERFDC